jgi:hypothetical protein
MKAVGPVSFSNNQGTYTRMKRLEELGFCSFPAV